MIVPHRALVLSTFVLLTGAASALAQNEKESKQDQAPKQAAAPLDQEARERKFAEDLSGVVFNGSYSVTGPNGERPAQMEKYTISKVSRVKDDYWLFVARIQYGKTDLTVPMQLQVKWAGDTPVITLTDLTIPGLGTFSSRVLIYGDRYAGTWQHDKVGGHLWGKVEKIKQPAEARPETKQPNGEKKGN